MDRFDKELGQAKTVSMKIDTGEHLPVKLKPYRVPLHKNVGRRNYRTVTVTVEFSDNYLGKVKRWLQIMCGLQKVK